MKRKIFVATILFSLVSVAFSQQVFTLKGGFSMGMSNTSVNASEWSEGALKTEGKGLGFYVGADFLVLENLNIFVDVPVHFAKSFKYDGVKMNQSASYLTIGPALGVSYMLYNSENFNFYLGAGLAVDWQTLKRPKKDEELDYINSKYVGLGLDLKAGIQYFFTNRLGLDLCITDVLSFLTISRSVTVNDKNYNLKSSSSKQYGNFLTVNLSLVYRFGI